MGKEQEPQSNTPKPLFASGQVVSTPSALEAFQQAGQHPLEFLARTDLVQVNAKSNANVI